MKDNIIIKKSYNFALNVLINIEILNKSVANYVLTKQLIRSATSIGANVEEAQGGESKKDFSHKISIAYKEAKESKYWLRLIKDSQLKKQVDIDKFINLLDSADEICRILYGILKSSKT